MRSLPLMAAVVFLGFFRARWAVRPFWEGSDDACYRTLALFWTGLEHAGCHSSSYFPGVALLWVPASALTLLTQGWGVENAMGFWVGIQTYLMWIASAVLLCKILRRRFPDLSEGWVWCLLLNVPLLYYATSRTSLPHVGEWCLALAMWNAIEKKQLRAATVFGLWLTATRFNDAPALLMVVGALQTQSLHRRWVLATFALAGLFCLGVGYDLAVNGYNQHPLIKQIYQVRFGNAGAFLWGAEWGVLWSTPLWAVGLVAGPVFWRRLSGLARGAWSWMALEAVLCATWPTNGSDFGYRYLIGSYVGLFAMGIELWPRVRWPNAARTLAIVGALWLGWQTWVFRTHPLLTPAPIFRGYRVADFQTRAVVAIGSAPIHRTAIGLSPIGTISQLATRHGNAPWGVRVPHLFGIRAWLISLLSLLAGVGMGWGSTRIWPRSFHWRRQTA